MNKITVIVDDQAFEVPESKKDAIIVTIKNWGAVPEEHEA